MNRDLIRQLEGSKTRELFKKLYGSDNAVIDQQINRYQGLLNRFLVFFPDADKVELFSTSGRTEVGGNHTDHNAGRVLAAAVNFDTIAAAEKTDDNKIILYSEGYPEVFEVDLNSLEPVEKEKETTTALIRGTAARFHEFGYSIGGFRAYISSSVARGSGLSSSASIEVLLGTIMNTLYNDGKMEAPLLAKIGQYAENEYFGKPCGLMDQMACSVGGFITIDFKDSENPVIRKIDFDLAARGYHMLVVDTGGNHADLTQDYADVPREMKSVAEAFNKRVCRELTAHELLDNISALRERTGDRAILRALHFFADDQRVVEQAQALEEDRFHDFLRLVSESGSSSWRLLQNCYTTQNPQEQGVTLALAVTEHFIKSIGEGACRVHGGGFAGTIQAYIPDTHLQDYIKLMDGIFGNGAVTVLSIRPYGSLHLNNLLG